MSQGPLCPNLTKKVQKEVSQMANRKLSCAMLYRWFKCKLKPPKKVNRPQHQNIKQIQTTTKTRPSHPVKFQMPPPDAPLIPQFHPLNPITPMPAFQPQEGKPHMHLKPTPALTPPAGPLPKPIPQ